MLHVWQLIVMCVYCTYSCPMLYIWSLLWCVFYCTYSCLKLQFDSDFGVFLLYLLLSHATCLTAHCDVCFIVLTLVSSFNLTVILVCFYCTYSCPMLHVWQLTVMCLLYLLLSNTVCLLYFSCPMLQVWQRFVMCIYCTYSFPMLDVWQCFVMRVYCTNSCPMLHVWQCFVSCVYCIYSCHMLHNWNCFVLFTVLPLVPCYMFDSSQWCVYCTYSCPILCVYCTSLVPCYRFGSDLWCVFIVLILFPC